MVNPRRLTVPTQHHHLGAAAGFEGLGEAFLSVRGFNAKVAVLIANVLGSMAFFWVTVALAFTSLPAVLTLVAPTLRASFPAFIIKPSLIALVAWVAQTFIQLVALPVLQVSSNAQGKQQDTNTHILLEDGVTTREHTEKLLDLLDLKTEGGLTQVRDEILAAMRTKLAGAASYSYQGDQAHLGSRPDEGS